VTEEHTDDRDTAKGIEEVELDPGSGLHDSVTRLQVPPPRAGKDIVQ
jgi:hypothetical protein